MLFFLQSIVFLSCKVQQQMQKFSYTLDKAFFRSNKSSIFPFIAYPTGNINLIHINLYFTTKGYCLIVLLQCLQLILRHKRLQCQGHEIVLYSDYFQHIYWLLLRQVVVNKTHEGPMQMLYLHSNSVFHGFFFWKEAVICCPNNYKTSLTNTSTIFSTSSTEILHSCAISFNS